MGVGDYWDHVDQYIRNHLSEMQCVDKELLQRCVARMPAVETITKGPQDREILHTRQDCVPGSDTTRQVVERNVGAFLSDGGHPAEIPRHTFQYTICCLGNGTKGMYYAWKSIVDYNNKAARINLLLNRASPWLDMDSYLPYEGKVVIRNKTAGKISVRMPLWVDKNSVRSKIGGTVARPFWNGRYAVFDSVKGGDMLTMEFPVVESTETYTLKWNQSDFWFESNWAKGVGDGQSKVYLPLQRQHAGEDHARACHDHRRPRLSALSTGFYVARGADEDRQAVCDGVRLGKGLRGYLQVVHRPSREVNGGGC